MDFNLKYFLSKIRVERFRQKNGKLDLIDRACSECYIKA